MASDSITAGSDRPVSSITLSAMTLARREERITAAALGELAYARSKWPGNAHLTLALAEESGKLVKAVLDHRNGLVAHVGEHTQYSLAEEVRRRIASTIAVAMRLGSEGDPNASLGAVFVEASS